MPFKDKEKSRQYHKIWKRRTKDWFWEFKKTLKCETCGFSHPAALHFHHKRDKKNLVSRMVQMNSNREMIALEVAKCQVLCANCHAVTHYEQDHQFQR